MLMASGYDGGSARAYPRGACGGLSVVLGDALGEGCALGAGDVAQVLLEVAHVRAQTFTPRSFAGTEDTGGEQPGVASPRRRGA